MTVLEIQRVIRRISDALRDTGSNPANPKLAEDFATACHTVNLRLQQCEAMINAGDRHQAIQLAEAHPNLLDCVTALEFGDADHWRAYCEKQGLPVADKIDSRAVHSLNECYAQGIPTDHPLYAVYRTAVLSRSDEDALKALQSITRLNPSDANAAAELDRLDAKVLRAKLSHLADLQTGSSPEVVAAQVEAIEAFGFKNRPEGETWCRSQLVRCGVLLDEAAKLQTTGKWTEVLAKLDLVHRLQTDFKLSPDPGSLRKLEAVDKWARSEQQKHERDRDFNVLIGELHYGIQQSEEKDTSARFVKLGEMKEDYEALHKVWRNLQDFTRPIPNDATAAFEKRSSLLETEIARRTRIRRRSIVVSVASTFLVAAVASWFALSQFKARDLARGLNEAVSQRQVRTAQKLLEQANGRSRLTGAEALSTAAAAAESFAAKERGLLENFQNAMARLPKNLSTNPGPEELASTCDALAAARSSFDSLAPDLKTENQPALDDFGRRWEKQLAQSSVAVNSLLEQRLVVAETKASELDYRSGLETVKPLLSVLLKQVYEITAVESLTNHLAIRSDLLQRSAAIQVKYRAYNTEFTKVDDGLAKLSRAKATGEYSQAIKQITSSEFSTSPYVRSAIDVQTISPTEETALRALLGATNASTWAFVNKVNTATFVPEAFFPAETAIFSQLNHDPAVSAKHQRIRLWLDADGTNFKEWITAGPLTDTVGWTTVKAYEPYGSPNTCQFADHEYGFFDGTYKLTPTQAIQKVQVLNALHEADAFRSVGLNDFGAATYSKSLLQVLDSIKDSREGSSLFRAYLFLRVVDIMELQPESWGLAFAPSISRHCAQIREIVGGELSSGDWFVTAKTSAESKRLDQFFDSIGGISYAKQAAGLLELTREAASVGLKYAGYADLGGQPKFIDNLGDGEIWGYSARTKQPVLIGIKTGSEMSPQAAGIPLGPLFMLTTSRDQILSKAGVNRDSPVFTGVLPQLFSSIESGKGSQP